MAGTFICTDCGKETYQSVSNNRQYCRECSQKRNRERARIRHQEDKESHASKNAGTKTNAAKKALLDEQKAKDAALDARSKKYIELQCRFCAHQLREGSNNALRCIGCDYISRTGRRADKGNGPGDCRSFEPMKKETSAEIKKRRERALKSMVSPAAVLLMQITPAALRQSCLTIQTVPLRWNRAAR